MRSSTDLFPSVRERGAEHVWSDVEVCALMQPAKGSKHLRLDKMNIEVEVWSSQSFLFSQDFLVFLSVCLPANLPACLCLSVQSAYLSGMNMLRQSSVCEG